MADHNYLEKKNFRALLEQDHMDRSQDALHVIDTFLDTEAHVTVDELQQLLRARGYDLDREFVSRCMARMVRMGFAHETEFDQQPVRYEHRHLGRHHDHLICTKCGEITEFSDRELERLQLEIATRHGFYMLQHKMEIYGLCSRCLEKREPLMPLTMAKPGEGLVIKEIVGGRMGRSRLASMGLRPGDRVEVITNNGHGRIILGHDCTRLAIGRGVAQKILVSSVDKQTADSVCNED